jgi:hypothetical protein
MVKEEEQLTGLGRLRDEAIGEETVIDDYCNSCAINKMHDAESCIASAWICGTCRLQACN